jgi:hypothetical protein
MDDGRKMVWFSGPAHRSHHSPWIPNRGQVRGAGLDNPTLPRTITVAASYTTGRDMTWGALCGPALEPKTSWFRAEFRSRRGERRR